jgi:putative effector of murein hydrolase LrgA (UPF0299 family)
VSAVSNIEPVRGGSLKQRFVPSAVVFVGAAVGVYATVWLALGVLRHIVMPILAVLVAGWLAQKVWRLTGRRSGGRHERSLPK